MTREAVILDTNLLILLIAGALGLDRIRDHKRLRNFNLPDDYILLHGILENASEIIVTPNVLTEASNLLRLVGEHLGAELTNSLGLFIKANPEVYVPSNAAVERPEFVKLGLTDAALLHLTAMKVAGAERLLLTMDFDLYIAALTAELKVVNFNELRDL